MRRSARMRNLTALLFLLSLCSLHVVSSAPNAFEYKDGCCIETTDVKIPLWKIKKYWRTGSSCPTTAIVFETKANKRLCVHPKADWVSGHMKFVDNRKSSGSKP